MVTKTRKTKKEIEAEESFHLDPKTCPGRKYFEGKEARDEGALRDVLTEVLGDIPKRMKQASDNRIWLWLITPLVLADTVMIVIALTMLSKIIGT
jgi:hypothetical protein